MNIIFSYAEEDESFVMDWEECIVETPHFEILCGLIYKARYNSIAICGCLKSSFSSSGSFGFCETFD